MNTTQPNPQPDLPAEVPKQKAVTKRSGDTIQGLLTGDAFKTQLASVLPKHLTPERFVRIALTAINKVPKLAQCDRHSFFSALLTLSQHGLEPDGRRAHLIPFENRKLGIVECTLIIDYKGLVELAMRSGNISNIHADVVCENDVFEYDRGEIIAHKIDFKKERGEVYAAYALVKFKDGTSKSEVMGLSEIESIRSRSKSRDNGPWATDFNEMAKKTCFRRLSKWITLSPEIRDAVESDDEHQFENRFAAAKPVYDATHAIAMFNPPPQIADVDDNIPMGDGDGGAK